MLNAVDVHVIMIWLNETILHRLLVLLYRSTGIWTISIAFHHLFDQLKWLSEGVHSPMITIVCGTVVENQTQEKKKKQSADCEVHLIVGCWQHMYNITSDYLHAYWPLYIASERRIWWLMLWIIYYYVVPSPATLAVRCVCTDGRTDERTASPMWCKNKWTCAYFSLRPISIIFRWCTLSHALTHTHNINDPQRVKRTSIVAVSKR